MVDVSSQNNSVSVNVSTGGTSASIKATPDMAQYYSEKSREWAISNRIIDNTDYSSKYYAEKSKESEAKAENYERSVIEKYNSFVEVSNQAEVELQTLRDDSISQINTVASSGISDIANKTSEAVTEINSNKEAATNEINNAKNSAVTQLSKEAQKQIQNIEKTGFYMRDDKLYFINSEGEEEEFKSGSGFNLFDTKTSDHILQGEQAKGWALQGTYVSGALYPDFYNKCVEEKNNAAATETTLADGTLTMFVNDNGHQFYNISDKSIVDDFYDVYGIADFYGIDEENERIFLPRNKYFHQLTDDVSRVNQMVEAGLPNIEGTFPVAGLVAGSASGALYKSSDNITAWGSNSSAPYLCIDASLSNPIYGNSDIVQPPSSLKLLYYCVGNTVVNEASINAGALVGELTNKANISLDNINPTTQAKQEIVSWGMPDYNASIALTWGAEYTAEFDCYIFCSCKGSTNAYISINGTSYALNGSAYLVGQFILIPKGTVFKTIGGSTPVTITQFPLKGAN